MFKSLVINEILDKIPIPEQEEALHQIGYKLISQIEELQLELESLEILTMENVI